MTPVQEKAKGSALADVPSPEDRFRAIFAENARPLLAYALRRTTSPADAADVVAESMMVAWRRIDEVPTGDETCLWLYGVARRVIANGRRGEQRRERLAERLAQFVERAVVEAVEPVVTNDALEKALTSLQPPDAEIIRLIAWEGLSPAEVAIVLDMPAATVRTRLHRARIKLRLQMATIETTTERSSSSGHAVVEGNTPLGPTEEGRS
jgi:RNA polymerase sigma factor (sigma-70 family)